MVQAGPDPAAGRGDPQMAKTNGRALAMLGSLWMGMTGAAVAQPVPSDGSVLPFPPAPMAGKAAPRLQDSTMIWPEQPQRLPKDAPNILIVLLDDVGFGVAETFGGEVHTPTLDRLAAEGIAYNGFHTTSICSPTRAALLTGRNHTRVGSGTIAERAVAWDGYTGVIPKNAATDRRGAEGLRLPYRGLRQVAQHAGDRDDGDRAEGPLAERLRLRVFLRLPRRRDLAVRAAADREFRRGRAAARRPELPPDLGHGGQVAGLARQLARLRPGQAVLHVLGAGRRARAAPRLQGVGRQVQGQVRHRLGRLSRAHLPAPARDGGDPAGHRAHAARPDDGGLGVDPGERSGRSRSG